jgi:hypothetical protein
MLAPEVSFALVRFAIGCSCMGFLDPAVSSPPDAVTS